MNPTVLLVDDQDNWGKYLEGRLRAKGFQIIWVKNVSSAIKALDERKEIQAVITNVNLEENTLGFLDTQGCDILQYIQDHRPELPKIALSALGDFSKRGHGQGIKGTAVLVWNLSHQYKVDYLVIKNGEVDPTPELVEHLNKLIFERNTKNMSWEAVIAIVVSAVSPYVVTLGTQAVESIGTQLGESVSGGVGELWKWIHHRIETNGKPEDKKLLKDFKEEPAKHQNELKRTLLDLAPTEDATLLKLTQNLFQELFELLDDPHNFTLLDLKRICDRVDVHWEDEVPQPTREALARWVVTYVQARQMEQELINAIVKIKPAVFSRKAR